MTDVSKMSDAELMALVNQQAPAPQQPVPGRGLENYRRGPDGAIEIDINQSTNPDFLAQRQSAPPIAAKAPAPDRPAPQEINEAVRGLARGVPVIGAAADEGNAAINAAVAPYLEPLLRKAPRLAQLLLGYDQRSEISGAGDFGDRFNASMNLQRFKDDTFDQDHPTQSKWMQGLGAVGGSIAALPVLAAGTSALPIEAGLLPKMAVGALEGAGIGGAQGYAAGSGGFKDPSRLEGGLQGGLIGGAAGAALPAAMTAGGALWKATGGKAIDAIKGARVPVQVPANDAEALAQALKGEAPVATSAAPLPPTTPPLAQAAAPAPATAPAQPRDLAEIIASRQQVPVTAVPASAEEDAYARIAQALGRQRQTPEEMISAVQALGPRGMIADSGEAVRDLARAAANRPSGAGDIVKKALDLRQTGQLVDGEFTVRPASGRILDQAAEGLGVGDKGFHGEIDTLLAARKAEAGPAYAKAYEAPPVDIGELRDFAGSKLFRDAYGRARSISEKEFVTLPDGTEQIVPLPKAFTSNEAVDWRTLDLMKQGLDDLVKEGKVQGIGANDQGATKGYLKRFVDKLDSINPDYKAAREAYAGPTAMKDALESGRAALREDAPEMAKTIAGLTDSEKTMYRLGALQGLKDKLGNTDITYDAARNAGYLKPNQLERFKELFPDKNTFAKFADMLGAEQTMFQTRGVVMGNSSTAKQLANMAEQNGSALETFGQGVVDAKTGNVMGLIRALGKVGGPAKLSEPTAEALASILTNMDQGALPQVAQRLTDAQKRQLLAETLRQSSGVGGVSATASAAQPKK